MITLDEILQAAAESFKKDFPASGYPAIDADRLAIYKLGFARGGQFSAKEIVKGVSANKVVSESLEKIKELPNERL